MQYCCEHGVVDVIAHAMVVCTEVLLHYQDLCVYRRSVFVHQETCSPRERGELPECLLLVKWRC